MKFMEGTDPLYEQSIMCRRWSGYMFFPLCMVEPKKA